MQFIQSWTGRSYDIEAELRGGRDPEPGLETKGKATFLMHAVLIQLLTTLQLTIVIGLA